MPHSTVGAQIQQPPPALPPVVVTTQQQLCGLASACASSHIPPRDKEEEQKAGMEEEQVDAERLVCRFRSYAAAHGVREPAAKRMERLLGTPLVLRLMAMPAERLHDTLVSRGCRGCPGVACIPMRGLMPITMRSM